MIDESSYVCADLIGIQHKTRVRKFSSDIVKIDMYREKLLNIVNPSMLQEDYISSVCRELDSLSEYRGSFAHPKGVITDLFGLEQDPYSFSEKSGLNIYSRNYIVEYTVEDTLNIILKELFGNVFNHGIEFSRHIMNKGFLRDRAFSLDCLKISKKNNQYDYLLDKGFCNTSFLDYNENKFSIRNSDRDLRALLLIVGLILRRGYYILDRVCQEVYNRYFLQNENEMVFANRSSSSLILFSTGNKYEPIDYCDTSGNKFQLVPRITTPMNYLSKLEEPSCYA